MIKTETLKEFQKCKNDILYFSENYLETHSVNIDKRKIKLYDFQKKVLKKLLENKNLILKSPSRTGKTTMSVIYSLWVSCFESNRNILFIVDKKKKSFIVFNKIKKFYRKLPSFLRNGIEKYTKTSLELENGSKISVSSIDELSTGIKGISVSDLIIDEMSLMCKHHIDDFWLAVYPILCSKRKSKIFITSSENTNYNKFYEIYSLAEKNNLNNWICISNVIINK